MAFAYNDRDEEAELWALEGGRGPGAVEDGESEEDELLDRYVPSHFGDSDGDDFPQMFDEEEPMGEEEEQQ